MRLKLDFSNIVKAIPALKEELAEITVDHVKDKIKAGVAPALKKPRRDGTRHTPLYHRGVHLYKSIESKIDKKGFAVGSDFVGARVLHNGFRGVPSRPFLELDEKLKAKYKAVFQKAADEGKV